MRREPRAVLGVDAAWTDSQDSGIALLSESSTGWRCVRVAPSLFEFTTGLVWDGPELRLNAELPIALETCRKLLGHDRIEVVAVDMPLAHSSITQRREADNQISRMFGHRKCAVHSPTPIRPGAFGRRMHEHLADAGFSLATEEGTPSPALIEVYPHVALLGMMGVTERLPYKATKTGKYWPGIPLPERKRRLVQEWRHILARLEIDIRDIDLALPRAPENSPGGQLKRIEDAIDALVCAWMAVQYLNGAAVPEGDKDAAIWIPKSALPFAKQNNAPH